MKNYPEFDTDDFERYGLLPTSKFKKPPTRVHRRRQKNIYQGPRLLIKRGIDQNKVDGGRIAARFEIDKFSFRDSIHCAPLRDGNGTAAILTNDQAKVILAILWSSLTRYYLFLTSGTWGLWHDEVKKDVLYSLPIRFPQDAKLKARIITAVDALRELPDEVTQPGLFATAGMLKVDRDKKIRKLEAQLDEAVYNLFGLTEGERERVVEFCSLELDLFYRGMKSDAVLSLDWPDGFPAFGRRKDLEHPVARDNVLCQYLATFLDLWEPQLQEQGGQLRWRIVRPTQISSMTAVMFETEAADDLLKNPTKSDEEEWKSLLVRLDQSTLMPTRSKRVYIDGLVRIITDSEIAVIKRNEHRIWTRSAARDDAEAAMVIAMQLSEQGAAEGVL